MCSNLLLCVLAQVHWLYHALLDPRLVRLCVSNFARGAGPPVHGREVGIVLTIIRRDVVYCVWFLDI